METNKPFFPSLLLVLLFFSLSFSQLYSQSSSKQQADPALKVTVLGSGGPVFDNERASSGYLIETQNAGNFIVDAGGGVPARIGEENIDLSTVDRYFLTHLHIDHTSSLPALLKTAYFQGRGKKPVHLYGPSGNKIFPGLTSWMNGQFKNDNGIYRYIHGFAKKVAGGKFILKPHRISTDTLNQGPKTIYEEGSFSVEAIPVKHGPTPALAYRFNAGKHSITYSGDLNSETGNLPRLAEGTDLLIHDAALNSEVPEDAVPAKLHSFPKEIAENARKAGVKTLLLSHIMPPAEQKLDAVQELIRNEYDGSLKVAEDGMTLVVPRNTEK